MKSSVVQLATLCTRYNGTSTASVRSQHIADGMRSLVKKHMAPQQRGHPVGCSVLAYSLMLCSLTPLPCCADRGKGSLLQGGHAVPLAEVSHHQSGGLCPSRRRRSHGNAFVANCNAVCLSTYDMPFCTSCFHDEA